MGGDGSVRTTRDDKVIGCGYSQPKNFKKEKIMYWLVISICLVLTFALLALLRPLNFCRGLLVTLCLLACAAMIVDRTNDQLRLQKPGLEAKKLLDARNSVETNTVKYWEGLFEKNGSNSLTFSIKSEAVLMPMLTVQQLDSMVRYRISRNVNFKAFTPELTEKYDFIIGQMYAAYQGEYEKGKASVKYNNVNVALPEQTGAELAPYFQDFAVSYADMTYGMATNKYDNLCCVKRLYHFDKWFYVYIFGAVYAVSLIAGICNARRRKRAA